MSDRDTDPSEAVTPPSTLPFVLGEVRRQQPQALSLTDRDKRRGNSKREAQAEVWAQPDTIS